MTDEAPPDELARLTAVDLDDLRQTLSHALLYDGRKRNHRAESLSAAIVADHLVQALNRSGYVVMRKPASHANIVYGPRIRPTD
jgi:hypothetical protein